MRSQWAVGVRKAVGKNSGLVKRQWGGGEKAVGRGINRVNNEGDSLGGFHLRIAAFDAGCANATAGQAINREKGWGINRVNNEGDS